VKRGVKGHAFHYTKPSEGSLKKGFDILSKTPMEKGRMGAGGEERFLELTSTPCFGVSQSLSEEINIIRISGISSLSITYLNLKYHSFTVVGFKYNKLISLNCIIYLVS